MHKYMHKDKYIHTCVHPVQVTVSGDCYPHNEAGAIDYNRAVLELEAEIGEEPPHKQNRNPKQIETKPAKSWTALELAAIVERDSKRHEQASI